MAKIVHAMIRVLDEERSVDFYSKAFDLQVADRFAFDGFTLVYLRNNSSDFEVELTINQGRTEPYDLGEGYGHLAVVVEDLEAERRRFENIGLMATPIKELSHDGTLLAKFFFIQDPDGYRIEVLQRHGRYR